MNTLIDVNVVFAIVVERHVHHAAAWHWWEKQSASSVGLCLPVRLGLLRLLTNARAMENTPVNPDEALALSECRYRSPSGTPVQGFPRSWFVLEGLHASLRHGSQARLAVWRRRLACP